MNIINIVLDKKFELVETSSIQNDRLLKKVISDIANNSKKDIGNITYRGSKYIWKKTDYKAIYIVSIVDITELEHYKKLAWIDDLTGVYNRHALRKLLESLATEIVREKRNLGVLFVDVDNLKSINANFGYVGGDLAISQVGKLTEKALRKSDLVFRYGGDEFLVLCSLIDDGIDSLKHVSNRIVKLIESKTRPRNTVSLGGVVLNTKQTKELLESKKFKIDWNRIIKACDKLVRKSKTSGKNQYHIARYE